MRKDQGEEKNFHFYFEEKTLFGIREGKRERTTSSVKGGGEVNYLSLEWKRKNINILSKHQGEKNKPVSNLSYTIEEIREKKKTTGRSVAGSVL